MQQAKNKCSICNHPLREAIEHALYFSGATYSEIAKEYGTSPSAISRHVKHSTPPILPTEQGEGEPKAIMIQLQALTQRAEMLYQSASRSKDAAQALKVLREMRELVRLAGQVSGELNERQQVIHQHLHVSPEWLTLRGRMLQALAPYPEAQRALISALGDEYEP